MPDFRLQLLYKSPCSVWCNNAFMSRFPYGRRWLLCIVRNSFRNSWLPILASIPSKLSLLLYCRVNDGKAVTAWKRLTETVYTLYGWDSVAIIRLRHILHLRKVSTCFLCSFSLFLLDRERITYQATLFICYRSTRLYSGVLTYSLPIMLLCAVRLLFSNRHGYRFSCLTGSSPVWDFSDSFWFVYNLFFYQQIYRLLECDTIFKVHCHLEHLWKVLAVPLLLGFLVIFSLCTLSLTVTTSRYSSLITFRMVYALITLA